MAEKIDAVSTESSSITGCQKAHDGTEHKNAEEAELICRDLLDNAGIAYQLIEPIMDEAGKTCDTRYISVNAAFEALSGGYKIADILGRTTRELYPQAEPYWFESCDRVLKSGKPVTAEYFNHDTQSWFRIQYFPHGERRVASLFTDITERKKTEEALRKSEENLRAVVENSRDGINLLDLKTGRYVFMSPAQVELTGFSLSEINNISAEEAAERVHPDDREISVGQQKRIAAGLDPSSTAEYRWKVKSGEYRWFSDSRKLIRDAQGIPIALVGISRDITNRKRAEAALISSEAKYRELASSIREFFLAFNLDWIITYTNEYTTSTLGLTPHDLIGKNVWELFPGLIGTAFWENYQHVMVQRESRSFEAFAPYHKLWLEIRVFPSQDGIVVLGTDITKRKEMEDELQKHRQHLEVLVKERTADLLREFTARKQTEERLAESEEKFRSIVEKAFDAVVLLDTQGTIIYGSPAAGRIFGYKPGEIIGRNFLEFLPEPKRTVIAQTFAGVLSSSSIDHMEVESLGRDGTIKILEVNANPVIVDGKTTRVQVVYRDITQRIQSEKALRMSEENFRNSLDNSPLGIRIVDAAGETLHANKALLEIYDYDSIDKLLTTPVSLRYTDQSYSEHQIRVERRRLGLPVPDTYEISIVREDGKTRNLKVFRREVIWQGKKEYLMTYEDITEQKRTDEMLKVLSHRLLEIQEEERSNIARELHDQIGQPLVAIKILLERANTANDKDRRNLLNEAMQILIELMEKIGTLSLELRPSILDDLGLVQALDWYFNRFTSQTNIMVQFEPPDFIENFGTSIETTIYRVAQEALTNVARHAQATMVKVELKTQKSNLNLLIEDNGIGFNPASISPANSGGIIGMQERVNLVGGTLQVHSQPGCGTCLIIEIPYQSESGRQESQE